MQHVRGRSFLFLYLLTLVFVPSGVLVSFHYDWPDFVHTEYGFPFVWAAHTTITITGPANIWSVNLPYLGLNIAIWQSTAFLIFYAFLRLSKQRAQSS